MIIRIEKNSNYTVMANYALNDKDLSLKARGLWAYLMTKPDEWEIKINGVASQVKEGADAIRAAFKELEDAGYLERGARIQRENGTFYYESATLYEKPRRDKPLTDKPLTENPRQVNTDKVNTDKVNNNTNVLLERSSLFKPEKKEYGDPDVNAVIKAFQEKVTGHKLTNMGKQRIAASNLIKTHSLEVVLQVIDAYAVIQTEAYSPHIDSVDDLYHKWDKVMGFGRRRVASQDKNKAVDLSEL